MKKRKNGTNAGFGLTAWIKSIDNILIISRL